MPPKIDTPPFEGLSQYFPEPLVLDTDAIGRYRIIMDGFRQLERMIERIESCGYMCEAGPLEFNVDFIRLKAFAKALRGNYAT